MLARGHGGFDPDGAREGLQDPRRGVDGRDCGVLLQPREHEREVVGVEQRHVARAETGERRTAARGLGQAACDRPQRTLAAFVRGIVEANHAARKIRQGLLGAGQDEDPPADLRRGSGEALEDGHAVDLERALVDAHAARETAGEEQSGGIRGGHVASMPGSSRDDQGAFPPMPDPVSGSLSWETPSKMAT